MSHLLLGPLLRRRALAFMLLASACESPAPGADDAGDSFDGGPGEDAGGRRDAAGVDDAGAGDDGGPMTTDAGPAPRTVELVYATTDIDPAHITVRDIGQLIAYGDRLFWTEHGHSETRTWGIWSCILPDCASPQRLTDSVTHSLRRDESHLYFTEDAGGVAVRIARCPLSDPTSCATPEVLAPAWGTSGVFTELWPLGGAVYVRDVEAALHRCASTSDCTSAALILPGGAYEDVAGDAANLYYGQYYREGEVAEQPLAACPTTGCASGPAALPPNERPEWVTSVALRGTMLYFVDETHPNPESRPSRLMSCDISDAMTSCAATATVMGSFDMGPAMGSNRTQLLVDDSDVYVLSLLENRITGENVVRVFRCGPDDCGSSSTPELLAMQRTPGIAPSFAMTADHLYWNASPPTGYADEAIYRVARR